MVPLDELEGYRKNPLRRNVVVGVTIVVAAVAVIYLAARPAPSSSEQATRLPPFELPLLSRDGTLSREDLIGSPVVMNFWASWCGPCREEAPLLERAWRAYKDDGVLFVGVNIRDLQPAAKDFVDEFGMTYPVVRDPDQVLAEALNVVPLPQTFFIAADGSFVGSHAGPRKGLGARGAYLGGISEEELDAQIEKLLTEDPR